MTDIVNWPARSGSTYQTEVFPIGTRFNPVSGVYILCMRAITPGRWDALYVGEAQSLYDRLNAGKMAHDGLICATRRGATHVAVMRTYSEPERLRIETDLRHGVNPPCNKQPVPARLPARATY